MDPPVSPRLVLPGQPQHHRPDLAVRRRAPGAAPARQARPPAADDVAVPAQDRAGSDDQPHRREALRPAASRQAAPATPGPATSDANEHEAAHARRQRADGAASRISASFHHDSRRDKPSSDTARETIRKISFKPTSRRSSHLRPGQDRPGRHRTRDRADRASARASAQVAQVFGTHKSASPAASIRLVWPAPPSAHSTRIPASLDADPLAASAPPTGACRITLGCYRPQLRTAGPACPRASALDQLAARRRHAGVAPGWLFCFLLARRLADQECYAGARAWA